MVCAASLAEHGGILVGSRQTGAACQPGKRGDNRAMAIKAIKAIKASMNSHGMTLAFLRRDRIVLWYQPAAPASC